MKGNRLADYLTHMQAAAADACGFVRRGRIARRRPVFGGIDCLGIVLSGSSVAGRSRPTRTNDVDAYVRPLRQRRPLP
jgi:hypothetical protein